jgi:hypothetical protein
MFPIRQNTQDSTQALLNRLDEVHLVVRELARIILPKQGDFHSVWDIANQVFDDYYHHVKAA